MNKTMIQYRNKTITHYHDHVHLHSPGDWASLWIVAIVMIGVIIAVTAVACLVSNKKVICLCGADKYGVGGPEVDARHEMASLYILVFCFRCGSVAT